ncbi:proline iminopeptidase protein [Coniophora puteana RWD-64-598 SS2]|uniref:Proline iminopeptidase protein n=1 Tax=Coniophora puteana (strain RWD-64-598) TaxID=741705 RepID=A0A5M3MHL2_CONPW|nr:proline iminopeptidase protein [Coniophora puteana RWD-64-598 SS2]EIW78274.1 proline iminopeptidase protein [Coniophora puteana RWD-64-598 SS2]
MDDPEYQRAGALFDKRHMCVVDPLPKSLQAAFVEARKDTTVNHSMNGQRKFENNGSLKDYSIIENLYRIEVPTLVLNGRYDSMVDKTVKPFFWRIPQAKWVQFAESSHTAYVEEPDRFFEVVGRFLELTPI